MYNVAVCDDTEEERLQAAEYAGRFFEREGIEVHMPPEGSFWSRAGSMICIFWMC